LRGVLKIVISVYASDILTHIDKINVFRQDIVIYYVLNLTPHHPNPASRQGFKKTEYLHMSYSLP
jgi:hypothetical protein